MKRYSNQQIPKAALCHTCKERILIGLYDAQPIHCDPGHLAPATEALARLLGFQLWQIVTPHVYRRTSADRSGYILREHRCGIKAPTGTALHPPEAPPDDEPGF